MSSHRTAHVEFSDIAVVRWLHKHRRGLFAIVYLWFVAYSTLLPFDFHWAIGQRNLASLTDTARTHSYDDNLTDVFLNVVLYVPLGAAVCLAVHHRVGQWWVGMMTGFFVGGLLTTTIEFLQLFSSSRVGSATDILTNTIGTLMGCFMAPAAGMILRFFRRRRREALAAQPLWHLSTWAAIALIICGLVPFDIREDLGQLREGFVTAHFRPFWQLAQSAASQPAAGAGQATFWVDFAGDAGAFLLFGALVAMAATADVRLGVIASVFVSIWSGIALAVFIEVCQIMIASRGFDTTDVIAAAAGTMVGAIFGTAAGRLAAHCRWKWGGERPLVGTPLLVLVVLGQTAYLLAQGIEPFRFSVFPSGHALWSSIGLVPFRGYVTHLTPALVAEFVLKLARYGVLGVMLMILLRRAWPQGGRGFAVGTALTTLSAMLLSAAIEVTQLSIPGRYCDITDVVIAGMGALSGAVGTQWYIDAVQYARQRLHQKAARIDDEPSITHTAHVA